MISAITCWRRSARFRAPFRKLAIESDAEVSRMLSSPVEMAGKETPTISPMIAMTISSSTRVTPAAPRRLLLALPTDDVRIQPLSAGLSVGAVGDQVRLVAVL